MRGSDSQNGSLFSYVNLEERVPSRHPLRKIKGVVDAALVDLDADFAPLYAVDGRPGIPPERLLRAALVQILFSIRSETQLMEQMQYNLLFRWFVGLSIDEPVWVPTVFTKNREDEGSAPGSAVGAFTTLSGAFLEANCTGLKDLVRFAITFEAGAAGEGVIYRFLPPTWYDTAI